MGFTDWLGLATKKSKEFGLPEDNGQSAAPGKTMAGAVDPIPEDLCTEDCLPKILMVQDGEYSSQLSEYAIRMAGRLNCAILAVDISDKPLLFSGERKMRESDRFIEKARKNGEKFVAFAASKDIQATHVMDIGDTDEIITRMREHDSGIQYVLNRFVPETIDYKQDADQKSPVVALRCVQPQK